MSVTSGFFNSINHDRRYNASQMSAIFDGIINDGVFANIGVAFAVTAVNGVEINIGKGRAWFNSAWIYNDAPLPKTLDISEVVLDRIDAVVIEVDHNENVRLGDIKIVKGTPSSSPKRPVMVAEQHKHQYPLAYIYRKAGSTTVTQANITSMIGTSECPYITGILQVQNIDNIVAQWGAQWIEWYAAKVAETENAASELQAAIQAEFDIWFNDFKSVLEDDVATHLAAQVADLMSKFDTLAKEGAVYDTIEDSDLDQILGSDGTPIQGKTVFSSDGATAMPKPHDIGAVATDGTTPMAGHLDMNKHRVRNVAEPEEDGDGANKGYVDTAKEEAKAYTNAQVKKAAPRNLLDNSDWRVKELIVNQRGNTSYNKLWNYAIDRWQLGGMVAPTLTPEADGIKVVPNSTDWAYAFQYLEKLPVGVYTYAAKFHGNTARVGLSCTNGISKNITDSSGIIAIPVNVTTEAAKPYFRLSSYDGATVTWEWAALYEGEYTEDTLPEYQPKGYGAELAECMRYYYRNWEGSINASDAVIFASPYVKRSTAIVFPNPMRVTPTVKVYNPFTGNVNCIGDWVTDADVSVSPVYLSKHHFILGGNSIAKGETYSYVYEASADIL